MSGKAFIDHFSALEDPRQAWKVVYPLPEILLVVLCATLAGRRTSSRSRAGAAQARVPAPAPALRARHRLARHAQRRDERAARAALRRVLHRLGGEPARDARPTSWRSTARPRGGHGRRAAIRCIWSRPGRAGSGWCSARRPWRRSRTRSMRSRSCSPGSNWQGALVTIDAMGCQTEIAKAIRGKGADYLLALKDNWPALAEEVRRYFDTAPAGTLDTPRDHRRRPRPHRGPPRLRQPRRRLARLRPALPRRVALPRPRDDRHGRGRGRARRQDQHRPPLLPLLRPALRPGLRRRRPRPLGHREPPALGHGRRLPRRPHAAQDRQRTRQHGHHPPRRPQHRQGDTRQGQPQGPPKDPRMGRRLPPRPGQPG